MICHRDLFWKNAPVNQPAIAATLFLEVQLWDVSVVIACHSPSSPSLHGHSLGITDWVKLRLSSLASQHGAPDADGVGRSGAWLWERPT